MGLSDLAERLEYATEVHDVLLDEAEVIRTAGRRLTPYEPGMSKSIVDSYERDQDMARQPTNIQRTGHRVESRWDDVLSDWLPQYAIGKRKYPARNRRRARDNQGNRPRYFPSALPGEAADQRIRSRLRRGSGVQQ